MVPGIRELGEWVVGSKTQPRSSVTRFVKILDLGQIQRTWERRQVWRTEGRRQVVGCSGCRNCFSAFSLRLCCWTRLEYFALWGASGPCPTCKGLYEFFVISVCHSIQFVMWMCVGPAFRNKSCTGFHSCYAWLKVLQMLWNRYPFCFLPC